MPNKQLRKTLGENLRACRGDESQLEFSRKLKISRGYLSDLERGARTISLATLVRISRKVGVGLDDLLGH